MTPRPGSALIAALLLAGCGGSVGGAGTVQAQVSTTGAADAQTVTVGMNDKLKFVPTTVLAKVGAVTITADNLGKVPHNLVFDDESLHSRSGTIAGGDKESLTLTFDRVGIWAFECTFHSGMTGKVVVS